MRFRKLGGGGVLREEGRGGLTERGGRALQVTGESWREIKALSLGAMERWGRGVGRVVSTTTVQVTRTFEPSVP